MKKLILVVVLFTLSVVISACSSSSVERLSPDEYVAQFTDSETPHLLIDVRTPSEFNSGHIAGAINIPVDSLASQLSRVPADMPVIVYCRSGSRSGRASQILAQNDYTMIYDLGGIINWQSAGYPVQ